MLQCITCQAGIRNTGLVIDPVDQPFFCNKTEAIKDPETAQILAAVLSSISKAGACPCREPFEVEVDGYLSDDRHGHMIRAQYLRDLTVDPRTTVVAFP